MPSPTRKKGDIAEDIVEAFLIKKGYRILERNYLRKWGEIDIIAKNKRITHFIEVKSATLSPAENDASHEMLDVVYVEDSSYSLRPEENVTSAKIMRFRRSIQLYMVEHPEMEEKELQVDVYSVLLDFFANKAIIYSIDNVVLE